MGPRVHGLHSCYDEDADFTDYFLLCIVFIHSGISERLLYSRLCLITGDTEADWALSLILICTKGAHQLLNFVLDLPLDNPHPSPKSLARYLGP